MCRNSRSLVAPRGGGGGRARRRAVGSGFSGELAEIEGSRERLGRWMFLRGGRGNCCGENGALFVPAKTDGGRWLNLAFPYLPSLLVLSDRGRRSALIARGSPWPSPCWFDRVDRAIGVGISCASGGFSFGNPGTLAFGKDFVAWGLSCFKAEEVRMQRMHGRVVVRCLVKVVLPNMGRASLGRFGLVKEARSWWSGVQSRC